MAGLNISKSKGNKEEIKEVRYLTDEEFNAYFENYKKKHEIEILRWK